MNDLMVEATKEPLQEQPVPEADGGRATTSLRMLYDAQKKVISRQIGGLEGARLSLGLSRRKISQLLLVDPSAWSRWTKDGGEEAPPHVFRALQWYLTLNEKIPGLTPEYFIGRDPQVATKVVESQLHQLKEENANLAKKVSLLEKVSLFGGLCTLLLGILIFAQLMR